MSIVNGCLVLRNNERKNAGKEEVLEDASTHGEFHDIAAGQPPPSAELEANRSPLPSAS